MSRVTFLALLLACSFVATTTAASCEAVRIQADATYCIQGPVCGGFGDIPTGFHCPKRGDATKINCDHTLKSFTNTGECIAPADSTCTRLASQQWECVWEAQAKSLRSSTGGSAAAVELAASTEDKESSISPGKTTIVVIGVVAAAAAIAAVVRTTKRHREAMLSPNAFPSPLTPRVE